MTGHNRSDFLLFTEHWQESEQIEQIKLKNFSLLSSFCRSEHSHGGVAIYESDNCKYQCSVLNLSDYCVEGILECVGFKIVDFNVVISVIYRPPKGNFKHFLSLFYDLLTYLQKASTFFIVGGDFNINFLVPSFNLSIMSDIVASFNSEFVIEAPTRVSVNSSSCIDNVLTNNNKFFCAKVVDLHLSDHLSLFVTINLPSKEINKPTQFEFKRIFSKTNKDRFITCIKNENWQKVYNKTNCEEAFNSFADLLYYFFEMCFPIKKVPSLHKKRKNALPPEITHIKQKLVAVSDLLKKDKKLKPLHKILSEEYRKKLKLFYQKENDEKIIVSDNKSKTMWQIINNLQKKSRLHKSIEIYENGKKLEDRVSANKFNKHFVKLSTQHTTDFGFSNLNVPYSSNSFFLSPVCACDVVSLITRLKNSNSSGQDGISNNILKMCKLYLSDVIAFLINLCYEEGIFPSKLKLAMVIPIFKKGDSNDFNNYRAISLLSSISKIYEMNLKDQLTCFLNKYDLLSNSQHGFVSGRSTETALCSFQAKIVEARDNGLLCLGLMIDFSKAFDTVHHQLLLSKLTRYGIRNKPLSLFASYLKDRSQQVVINGSKSLIEKIMQGVPQGSVLGPLLFVIYINDIFNYLTQKISNVFPVCYADDTNILCINSDKSSLKLQAELVYMLVKNWSLKNNLIINKEKTTFLLFSPRGQDKIDVLTPESNTKIKATTTAKLLGVFFDSALLWGTHVENLCKRLRSNCYAIRFLTNYCSQKILTVLYYANIHSHIRYGILIWGASAQSRRILLLQKRAIRTICKLSSRESCRSHFRDLKILTIYDTYIMEVCIYAYKNHSLLESAHSKHGYNTRNKTLLRQNKHKTTLYQRNFLFYSIKFFNCLSDEIKSSPSLNVFRGRLRDMLLQKNSYSLEEFFL